MTATQRPTLPWRTFAEFVAYQQLASWKRLDPFCCLTCDGDGKVYDPDDPPCPIEGNKLRDRIKCQMCGGTGKGSEERWREWWRMEKADHTKEVRQWEQEQAMRRRILAKLTVAERKFLGMTW